MTVLYTTHYMEEAQELSDRVGIIDHGELIALGTQAELTRQVGENDTLILHVGEGEDAEALAAGAAQICPACCKADVDRPQRHRHRPGGRRDPGPGHHPGQRRLASRSARSTSRNPTWKRSSCT